MSAKEGFSRRSTFILVALIVIASIVAGTAYILGRLRAEAINRHLETASTYASTFEEHLTQSFNVINLTLAHAGAESIPKSALIEVIHHAPYLRSASLLDAKGIIAASSDPRNVGLRIIRGDFLPATPEPRAILRVGPPWTGRDFYDGQATTPERPGEPEAQSLIAVLRDVALGSNARTTLLASVNTDYFLNYYSRGITGAAGVVELLRYDGTLLLSTDVRRKPGTRDNGEMLSGHLAKEVYGRFEQKLDGGRSVLTSWRASRIYPFVIVVHLDKEAGLAGWRDEAALTSAVVATMLLAALALGGLYFIRMERAVRQHDIDQKQLQLRGKALAAAANAIIITDQKGMIEWANPAFCVMSGYPLDEVLGRNPRELIKSGQQTPESYQELWRTLLAGRVWHGELVNRRKNGSCYTEDQIITPVRDEDGEIHHFIAVKQDISERKEREEQTRRLLVENQTILGNVLVGIVYLKRRQIVSCNRRFEELFQYAPGELIGKSTALLYDTYENFVAIGKRTYSILGAGESYSEEVLLRHKDGSTFWGALNGCAIDPAHPDEGSIWIYADVSERRRAEQESGKLLRAVEQSPVSIVITNRQGIIEYVNPGFTRISGYTRDEVAGKTPAILRTEETTLSTYQELWRTILAGKTWRGVLHNRCKNGDLVWEETSISPIFDANREITHFVAVKEDVTERKRIEQQLAEHQAHLEELVVRRTAELSNALEAAKLADKAKDEFLANITHELRTPLSAVIGMAGLARGLSTDPVQRDYLDKIRTSGKHLNRIINDLLDLSKIVAGRLDFETQAFSLRSLIMESNEAMRHRAAEKKLELVETIDDAVPDVLRGDAIRLKQILLNLVGNAIKFTPAGRIEVRVGLHALEAAGSGPDAATGGRVCLTIDVEDSGVGMRPEDLDRLFKPFSQADATVSRKFGGTGLGLAICKRLAELMDGDISVTSREGSGSTFRVRLWLGLGSADELPVAEAGGMESMQVRYRDVRILVVDDQPFNRDIVRGLLSAVGITPQLAENGRHALDILGGTAERFDLVLMDVQMPVMDGLTATRAIRAQEALADMPVIAMTAHTMAHQRENCIAAGMNDHIGKPFDEADFYRVLAKWIPREKQVRHAEIETLPTAAKGLPALAGVDTRAGLALLLGDEARYRHWLSDFVAEAPAAMKQIRLALAAGTAEPASMAAHTLKGRMGLLGMKDLQAIAAALEAAIDSAAPTDELLRGLEDGVIAMCAEIQRGLGSADSAEPAAEPGWQPLPIGLPPPPIAQLIEHLQAGDSECEALVTDCLAELADTPWAPPLRQALGLIRKFDFVAASRLLSGDQLSRQDG